MSEQTIEKLCEAIKDMSKDKMINGKIYKFEVYICGGNKIIGNKNEISYPSIIEVIPGFDNGLIEIGDKINLD